jgi:hypothetical protein
MESGRGRAGPRVRGFRHATGQSFPLRLTVEVSEGGRPLRAFVPLFYFDEDEPQREPFNQAYRSLKEHLAGLLPAGAAIAVPVSGE